MDPLRRFARTLVQRLSETQGGAHRAVSVEEVRSRLLPYRAYRSVLRLESVEEYDLVVLRLVGEEKGFVRTLPPLAAERCRAEAASAVPNLDLLDQLAEVTIQIGAESMAGIFDETHEPPAAASPGRDDLDIIERHLELEVPEPAPPPVSEPRPPAPPAADRPAAAGVPAPERRGPPRVPQLKPRPPLVPRAPARPPQATPASHLLATSPRTAPPRSVPLATPMPTKATAVPSTPGPPAKPAPVTPPLSTSEEPRMAPSPADSCRSCRQSLPAGRQVVFCPWCGQRLMPFTCPRCHTELESQWMHCITCGSPVKDPYRFV